MRTLDHAVSFALLVGVAVTSSALAHDVSEVRHYSHSYGFLGHFVGHWGGTTHGHSFGYHIYGSCRHALQCCQYEFNSPEFNACCSHYGCCPSCETSDSGCRCNYFCKRRGGICRKYRCEEGEKMSWWGCYGYRCKCCTKMDIPVTEDCAGSGECCSLEAGSGEFFACCQKYNCCPVCSKPECTFGNETFSGGEVIRSYPERCLQLRCEVEELDEQPFYQQRITEVAPNASCGCCELGGKMYENGYLLTQDDYCLAVQCVDGEWVNQGYFNADCRVCSIQDPLAAAVSFDGTVNTVSDTSCSYSAVQEGSGYNPDSYVSVEFDPHTTAGFVDRTDLVFKDTGADPVTCPASDIQGCSFGPITETPKEINDVGTLALTTQLGSLTFNAILGVNQITTLYTDNSLLIMAPVSKFEELGGLCGEFNGDPADDLTLRDGTVTTDGNAFVTDWKMDPACVSTPARRGLRITTDFCASLPAQTLSDLTGDCVTIMAPLLNITEPLMDNCKQILCRCEQIDVSSCVTTLEELTVAIASVQEKEKSPGDLEELLQSALV
ncbi:uncharacterized protein LOC119588622 [Penaeus monodon]|uniref:uncharacterized protein LOC119588622 n=1 Tax=Penaeus monodon TaxID=6687 RepID=UPI0018A6E02B|nr:uncharacterized protein LOC119588622 [Penaeus monodon]